MSNAKQLIEIATQLLTLAVAELETGSIKRGVGQSSKMPSKRPEYDLGDLVQIVDYKSDHFGKRMRVNVSTWVEDKDKWFYGGDYGTYMESELRLAQRMEDL
jgi:hypothetical protein